MDKFEPIKFEKLSEAIAYLEDGGELFIATGEEILKVTELMRSEFDDVKGRLKTKAKPAPWYEKLDGTVENGVLCVGRDEKIVFLCTKFLHGKFYDERNNNIGEGATPLTRAEIQRFMDNAPEE